MSGFRNRKTDYGTIILHWSLVAALTIAVVSGVRIAAETPDRTWINLLDAVLPVTMVWTAHIEAAVALVAVSIAYAIYIALAGLGRRIKLDRVRLLGLFGRSQARWGAINVVLYWVFFITMMAQLVTGGLMYFGYANRALLDLHWIGIWVILLYPVMHVWAHWKLGGIAQLLRIVRPARLVAPSPPLDLSELLTLYAESSGRPLAPRETGKTEHNPQSAPSFDTHGHAPSTDRPTTQRAAPAPAHHRRAEAVALSSGSHRRGVRLQSNPFVVATAAGLVGVAVLATVDREATDTLHIHRIAKAEVPVLDGDSSDPVWRTAAPVTVVTEEGGNFDGKGETTVEIRAVHDGVWAYFLFVWNDPTRSLKQLPLMKAPDGWHLLHDGYELGDEHAYNEDKFAVLLTKSDVILAGDRTFHAGPAPASGKPGSLHGRGLHYTTKNGAFVDVWQWKATSTGSSGWCDDNHFGPAAEPTQVQLDGKTPYRGGFAPDPGTANYLDNFEPRTPDQYHWPVRPRRLPKDVAAATAALGRVDLDPNHGESDGARWYMTEAESTPYSRELDAQVPVRTVIPGVIIAGEYSGERASVRCIARWQAGRWALEAARRLDAEGQHQVAISTETFMRVAAFDHSQIRHTRHVRPIRLEVE